jgi:hypothetical protein
VLGAAATSAQLVQARPEPGSGGWRAATPAEYRAHLKELQALTAACAKARNESACAPEQVGTDDEIPWGAAGHEQKRVVRFGWLRALLQQAQQPDDAMKAKGAAAAKQDQAEPDQTDEKQEAVATTSQLLENAQTRLKKDLAEADAGVGAATIHGQERAVLTKVLAGREFRNLKKADEGPSLLERLGDQVNRFFEWLGSKHAHSAWVGRALIWGFLTLVGVGLAWGLLQMERRWRIRLVPDSDRPAPMAASARDWQLWLNDAREAAARGQWREAIHFLYWAAISRLESKKLWPADRARTPREYLALVAGDDPRKGGLGALTREFEWTWYGGRPAAETDYRRAEGLATELFEGGARARRERRDEDGAVVFRGTAGFKDRAPGAVDVRYGGAPDCDLRCGARSGSHGDDCGAHLPPRMLPGVFASEGGG